MREVCRSILSLGMTDERTLTVRLASCCKLKHRVQRSI